MDLHMPTMEQFSATIKFARFATKMRGSLRQTTRDLRRLSHALNIPLQCHVIITPSGRYSTVLE